jgi:hypothetical protein
VTSQTDSADQVYYDVAMQRLGQQLEQVDSLDRKLANAFAFSNAILGSFAAILAIRGEHLTGLSYFFLGTGVLAYIVAVWWSVNGYVMKPWSLRPDLSTLKSHCNECDNTAMRFWVGDECIRSIDQNSMQIASKAKAGAIAFTALPVQALLLAAAAVSSLT